MTENARTVDANDPDKVFEDYKSAESILLAEDAAQVPLYQSASNYMIRSTIKDIQFPAYGAYFYFRTASVEVSKNAALSLLGLRFVSYT